MAGSSNTTPLTEFQVTLPELQDESSVQALYGHAPPTRESNPAKWDKMFSFWPSAITQACRHFNKLTVTVDDVKKWFTHKKGYIPYDLEPIFAHMEADKKIQKVDQYTSPAGWGGWFLGAVAKSVWWSVEKIAQTKFDNKIQGSYVVLDAVKEKAEYLKQRLNAAHHSSEYVVLMSQILSEVPGLSDEDLILLFTYLERTKSGAILKHEGEIKGIKMNSGSITDADIGVLRLKVLLTVLEEQENKIAADIKKCASQITEYLRSKQRPRAMAALKKQKTLQTLMDKRMASAHTILEILTNIEAAVSNKQVMEAYSVGINTLKEVNKGVTVEKVEDLMDTLKDTLADQQEIDSALAGNVSGIDDDEVEEELNKLMAEEEAHKSKQKEASAAVPAPAKEQPNTTNIYAISADEEKELAELMGGMNVAETNTATHSKPEKRVAMAE